MGRYFDDQADFTAAQTVPRQYDQAYDRLDRTKGPMPIRLRWASTW